MRILVPFDARAPKTRLAAVLDRTERAAFARTMLRDVLDVLDRAGHRPLVLATEDVRCECPVRVDQRALSPAVNATLEEIDRPLAIVMADLPLLRVETVEALFDSSADIVIAPGLGGGTNALVVRTETFRVDYHGVSFRDHRRYANDRDIESEVVDSFRIAQDVDEAQDLIEVLLHCENGTADWLRGHGFRLDETGPEVTLLRSGESV